MKLEDEKRYVCPFDETLEVEEGNFPSPNPSDLTYQVQPTARLNLSPESHVFHATKSHVLAINHIKLASIETSQLSRTFALDDAGHQRKTRHVASNPEFVIGDILVSHGKMFCFVNVHDRGQLRKLMTLRIDALNGILQKDGIVEVNPAEIRQWPGRHRGQLSCD